MDNRSKKHLPADYSSALMNTISKVFVVDKNSTAYVVLSQYLYNLSNRKKEYDNKPPVFVNEDGIRVNGYLNTLQNQLRSFGEYLLTLERKSTIKPTTIEELQKKISDEISRENTRTNERVNSVIDLIGKDRIIDPRSRNPETQNKKIKSYLDIGGGNGEITDALGTALNLTRTSVFLLDDKAPDSTLHDYTRVSYDKNGNLPFKDGSVDLITMFVVLHHIQPHDRIKLLSEVHRVLSYGGLFIIREHDDNGAPSYFDFLSLIHEFWYVVEEETHDPLYLMSRIEIQQTLEKIGFVSTNYKSYGSYNPQRLYYESFMKVNKLPILFEDVKAQTILQQYIDRFNLMDHTYDNYVLFVPENTRKEIDEDINVSTENINYLWKDISKLLAKKILKLASVDKQFITSEDIAETIKGLI